MKSNIGRFVFIFTTLSSLALIYQNCGSQSSGSGLTFGAPSSTAPAPSAGNLTCTYGFNPATQTCNSAVVTNSPPTFSCSKTSYSCGDTVSCRAHTFVSGSRDLFSCDFNSSNNSWMTCPAANNLLNRSDWTYDSINNDYVYNVAYSLTGSAVTGHYKVQDSQGQQSPGLDVVFNPCSGTGPTATPTPTTTPAGSATATPSPTATATAVCPNPLGYIDSVVQNTDCTLSVVGWAWNPQTPSNTQVQIQNDGTLFTNTIQRDIHSVLPCVPAGALTGFTGTTQTAFHWSRTAGIEVIISGRILNQNGSLGPKLANDFKMNLLTDCFQQNQQ